MFAPNVLRPFARAAGVLLALAALASLAAAAKQFIMPVARPAKTYAAHDEHPTEAITAALDPYDKPDKANIFLVHYNEIGILPVLLIVTNDGDQPVSLGNMKAQ